MSRKLIMLISILTISLVMVLFMWSLPPKDHSTIIFMGNPDIATDNEGNIHAVWESKTSKLSSVVYAFKNKNSWSKPIILYETSGYITNPAIAANKANHIVVVWDGWSEELTHSSIFYTEWNGSSWSKPSILSTGLGQSEDPDVVFDSCGNLNVVWEGVISGTGADYGIFHVARKGNVLSGPSLISKNSTRSFHPAISADNAGNVHVIWQGGVSSQEIYYSMGNNGSWSPSTNISNNSGNSLRPAIASNSEGNAHIAWYDNSSGTYGIYYSTGVDGNWSQPINISGNLENSIRPGVIVDSAGNIYIVWCDYTTGKGEIYYSFRKSGNWSQPAKLSKGLNDSKFPVIAADNLGIIHVVWQDNDNGTHGIYYSMGNNGSWSQPINISL